jgi:hypothetical protein
MRRHAPGRMGRRWIRGWWPDRNPLRRRSDRVETAVATGLLATLFVLGPAVAVIGANGAYRASLRLQETEQASVHRAKAVLLVNAPGPSYNFAGVRVLPEVRARWAAPGSMARTGLVIVAGPAAAGSTVDIWVDASGRLAGPPLQHKPVTGQAVLGAMVGLSALAFVLACAWAMTRRTLRRRRLAAWDDDWGITSPRWTSRR